MPDLANSAQEIVITDETTGYKCNPDSSGKLPVTATVYGTETVGSSLITNPVAISGIDAGGLKRSILTDVSGRIITSPTTGIPYSAAVTNLAPAATATDVFTISGSGTKTIKVLRIQVSGVKTAHSWEVVQLIKRSTADSGGTSTAVTAVPHDSASAAATASVLSYTANPTTGTAIGTIHTERTDFPVQTPANAQGNGPGRRLLAEMKDAPVVLRGTNEQLAVNLNGVTLAGGSLCIYITWTEE